MEPPRAGFLENLYTGRWDAALASPRLTPLHEEKIAAFLERFREESEAAGKGASPSDMLAGLRRSGMFGLFIPAEYGGMGLSLPDFLAVIRHMSGVDMAMSLIPMAHLAIGVMGIILFGNEDQKRRYLPRAASGELVFGYALTEPETGSDAQHVRTTARLPPDGDCYIVEGTKTYITNANYAGAFSVFAQLDPENPGTMGMFIIERATNGVSVGPDMPKMGLEASSTAPVRFSGVRVPRENLVGAPGDGFKIAMTVLNYGRLALGAASSGLLSRSLADMSKRAASRKQFGAAIREFQLIQEKLVHARVHEFAASALTSFTAALLEQNPVMNVAMESSHCKLYGTTRCWDTLYDALQTAGGAGYLSTMPYEKRMRDFRVTTIFEGTTEIHSVYPPLALFRSYGKELSSRGLPGKVLLLRRIKRARALRAMGESNLVLRRAAVAAGRSEALFRRLLAQGLRRYGAGIVTKEFYLRRMTNLSMSLYWLVAGVWELKRRHPDGAYPQQELDIICYLTEEAVEVQAASAVTRNIAREAVLARIAKGL